MRQVKVSSGFWLPRDVMGLSFKPSLSSAKSLMAGAINSLGMRRVAPMEAASSLKARGGEPRIFREAFG